MKLLYFIAVSCFFVSCKTVKLSKKIENPTEDIAWLKEHIQEIKNSSFTNKSIITQYTYKGQTVYLVDNCYQCPDAIAYLYNAKKEKLCTFGGIAPDTNNCKDFASKAKNRKVLWKNF